MSRHSETTLTSNYSFAHVHAIICSTNNARIMELSNYRSNNILCQHILQSHEPVSRIKLTVLHVFGQLQSLETNNC